nr:hypothetical protein HUO10_003265 [Paraburkholderia busanensis]
MSDREKFEAWVSEYRKGKPYWSSAREEILWDCWQASRRGALEEAAIVCDEMADGWNQTAQGASDGRYDFMAEAGDQCSDEIRALANGDKS